MTKPEITFHHVEGSKHSKRLTRHSGVYAYLLHYGHTHVLLRFQQGSLESLDSENGVTNEQLLAVVIDRLEHFQQGEFACEENQNALDILRVALDCLTARTRRRMARGVEGTHTP